MTKRRYTATRLRANLYRVLDEVLATGIPVEIERKGQVLRIESVAPRSRLTRLRPHPKPSATIPTRSSTSSCLYELGRIGEPAARMLDELGERIGLTVCSAPFPAVAREAERHSWTRDPFDRLIVAQASLHDAPLLTADSILQTHYARAVW